MPTRRALLITPFAFAGLMALSRRRERRLPDPRSGGAGRKVRVGLLPPLLGDDRREGHADRPAGVRERPQCGDAGRDRIGAALEPRPGAQREPQPGAPVVGQVVSLAFDSTRLTVLP